MNKASTIIGCGALLAVGAGTVIMADRQGWLGGPSPFTEPVAERDWCAEHGVPESQCVICHPGLVQAKQSRDSVAENVVVRPASLTEAVPRSQRAPSVTCTTTQKVVQFASVDIARQAGLAFVTVERQPISRTLECAAQLAFNAERVAHLSPRTSGVVQQIVKTVGDRVEAGDLLAMIDSVELGSAKAEYLQGRSLAKLWQENYNRQLELTEGGITTRRALIEAQTSLAEAEIAAARAGQRLRSLGLDEAKVRTIAETGDTSSTLELHSPFAGVIIERHAVLGEVVDVEHSLFTVADISTMWAMLDIYETDVRHVKAGQKIVLSLHGMEGETFGGTLQWLASSIDPTTRTLKARAQIDNSDGRLRANMFGKAAIVVKDGEPSVVVPKSAVQWEGCCNIVFVRHTDTVFQPYKVKLGFDVGDYFVVEEGIEPGEQIVTQGAFLLKTEILKGSIGAGCCEVHGAGGDSH